METKQSSRTHHYEVSLALDGANATLAAPPRPTLVGGAPSDFGGTDDVWSPEHLLLASVNLCLMTTFKALAARQPFERLDYRDRIEGTVEKTAQGLRLTSVKHHVELHVAPADRDRAKQVLESASKHCIIGNALNIPVELDAVIE